MKRKYPLGCCFAAFGAGLLLATVFPPRIILILAAVALVALGYTSMKR